MAITTLAKVKTILGITASTQDALITALIPMIENDYLAIRNKSFDVNEDDETVYPVNAELTAIKMINYHLRNGKKSGIASESLGDYSVSFIIGEDGYPKDITSGIKKHAKFL